MPTTLAGGMGEARADGIDEDLTGNEARPINSNRPIPNGPTAVVNGRVAARPRRLGALQVSRKARRDAQRDHDLQRNVRNDRACPLRHQERGGPSAIAAALHLHRRGPQGSSGGGGRGPQAPPAQATVSSPSAGRSPRATGTCCKRSRWSIGNGFPAAPRFDATTPCASQMSGFQNARGPHQVGRAPGCWELWAVSTTLSVRNRASRSEEHTSELQ